MAPIWYWVFPIWSDLPRFCQIWSARFGLAESSAKAGVAPTPGRCFTHYTGFRWGSGSPINWLYWLTRCGPQPLQCISASWYRPVHHLVFCADCALSMLVVPRIFLLLLHPPGTLYLLRFDCAKTFSLSNATWKPIYSNSLSPPVLHQAPLYLRT